MASHIKAFRAVSNDALKSKTLPVELKILDWGTSQVCDGSTVTLDERTLKTFSEYQKKHGRTRVALDYNHCTVPGTSAHKDFGDQPAIFAYGTPEIRVGEGLFLNDITWTPFGKKGAKNCADISPAVKLARDGELVTGLDSCALTPTGAVDGLSFYSADSPRSGEQPSEKCPGCGEDVGDCDCDEDCECAGCMSAAMKSLSVACFCERCDCDDCGDPKEDCDCNCHLSAMAAIKKSPMKTGQTRSYAAYLESFREPPGQRGIAAMDSLKIHMKDTLKYFRAEFGLADSTPDAEVLDILHGKWEGLKKDKQPIIKKGDPTQAGGPAGDTGTEEHATAGAPHGTISYAAIEKLLDTKLKVLSAEVTSLKAQRDTETKTLEDAERARIVAAASAEGKLIPLSADTIKVTPVALLKEIVGKLSKATVPITRGVKTLTAGATAEVKALESTSRRQATVDAWAAEGERLMVQAGIPRN